MRMVNKRPMRLSGEMMARKWVWKVLGPRRGRRVSRVRMEAARGMPRKTATERATRE